MKRFVGGILALTLSTASAQPEYFSGSSVRNDIAKRLGAYETSCSNTPIHVDDELYSSCMFISGGGKYAKDIIDIYYDDYMTGGWRFIDASDVDTWIRNTLKRDYRTVSINIIEQGDRTYITVYDVSLAVAVENNIEKDRLNRKASTLGATPNATYVTLGQLKPLISTTKSGNQITLKRQGNVLAFTPGSRTASLNGQSVKLNALPFVMDGATYFPLAATQFLGCSYDKPDYFVGVTCGSEIDFLDYSIFSNKNAPPTVLQPSPKSVTTQVKAAPAPAATVNSPRVPTASQPVPMPKAAVKGVAYASLNTLGSLGILSNMADGSSELLIGSERLTFMKDKRMSKEGTDLGAMVFYLNSEKSLVVPVNSLDSLGCSVVVFGGNQFAAKCPNGTDVSGPVLSW